MPLKTGLFIFLFLFTLQVTTIKDTNSQDLSGIRNVKYRHFLETLRPVVKRSTGDTAVHDLRTTRMKRSTVFNTGVKVCPQETMSEVIASHRAYYRMRVCQEAVWEAFQIFLDRVPDTIEYHQWVEACQRDSLCVDDLVRNFSSNQEHLDMVAKRVNPTELQLVSGFPLATHKPAGEKCSKTAAELLIIETEEKTEAPNVIPEEVDEQIIVEFSVTIVEQGYSELLADPDTPQYHDITQTLHEQMVHILDKLPGFKEIRMLGFRPEEVSVHYAVVFENGHPTEPGGEAAEPPTEMDLRQLVAKALSEDTSLPVDILSLSFVSDSVPTQRGEEQGAAEDTAAPDGGEVVPEDVMDETVPDAVPEFVDEEIDEVAETPVVEDTEGDSELQNLMPDEQETEGVDTTPEEALPQDLDEGVDQNFTAPMELDDNEVELEAAATVPPSGGAVMEETTKAIETTDTFLVPTTSASVETVEAPSVTDTIESVEPVEAPSGPTSIEPVEPVEAPSVPSTPEPDLPMDVPSVETTIQPVGPVEIPPEPTVLEPIEVPSEPSSTADTGTPAIPLTEEEGQEAPATASLSPKAEVLDNDQGMQEDREQTEMLDYSSGDAPETNETGTAPPQLRLLTTPSMVASNQANDLVVFFSLRVTNMIFSDDLFDKSSPEYKSLENTFLELRQLPDREETPTPEASTKSETGRTLASIPLLPYLQSNLTGFKELEILNFRNGSVVVNSKMKLEKPVPYNVTEAVTCVLEEFCNAASNRLDLEIDSGSLDVESADHADPCKFMACNEFSRCVINTWSMEAECLCDPGYSMVDGLPCQSICALDPAYCLNDGQCEIIAGHGATCRCPVGKFWHYHGERCTELVSLPIDPLLLVACLVGGLALVCAVIGLLVLINKKCIRTRKTVTLVHTQSERISPYESSMRVNPVFQNDDGVLTQVARIRYPLGSEAGSSQVSEQDTFHSVENIHVSIEIPRQLYTTRSDKLVSDIVDFHHCIPQNETWRIAHEYRSSCCLLRGADSEGFEVTVL
ncbi:interphotoreceptor matrix proteoglycan 1 isoform X1 [Alosa alosa]|uniref:interphotoreceptor matrix proteoglycan 1 isoform X1 n=1 Tax=Alosa alosa TaxID=278164 RepID=UPI0020151132|nr:interphotoreceptor matrix proteoglycan 1 isoform X1 [Alosa alosa]